MNLQQAFGDSSVSLARAGASAQIDNGRATKISALGHAVRSKIHAGTSSNPSVAIHTESGRNQHHQPSRPFHERERGNEPRDENDKEN
ncbi:hypothetical protein [Bradyrhizobium manausense]|uniref:hypothetical protein n=1 Tax=Bradyrhizobium manausense TaxID=989370 RepID=UPI0012ED87B7|nr:hypothetical protein [Bradyrhizobium manausense]